MAVSVTLSDGDTVLVYRNGFVGLDFEFANSQAEPTTSPVQVASSTPYWLDATADSSGGFTIAWVSAYTVPGLAPGQLYSASYDSTGSLITPAHAISSWTPSGNALAFSSADQLNPDGRAVSGGVTGGGAGADMILNLSPDVGYTLPEGPPLEIKTSAGGGLSRPQSNPLAGGGAVVAYVENTNSSGSQYGGWDLQTLVVDRFDAAGRLLASVNAATINTENPNISAFAVSGLADGGFAVSWQVQTQTGYQTATTEDFLQEYNAQGQLVGSTIDLGAGKSNNTAPSIIALASGAYSVSWTDASGLSHQASYTEQGAGLGATSVAVPAPPPTGKHIVYTNSPDPLPSSIGWTGAAILSNHEVAVVDIQAGQYGSTTAAEQTYSWDRTLDHSTSLQGYAGVGQTLTPTISALPVGGFYQVGYAGSTDYEIYNGNGQLVFQHNQYTSPTAALAPLVNGGYVTTDSGGGVFGLFDANNNNVGWISMPSNAAGAPIVTGLTEGGFAFTYAGSGALDVFSASGNLLGAGSLGATASSFASATAALSNGQLLDVWLSPDGGQYGLATTIELQAFDSSGNAKFAPIQVAQDLDPWHTAFLAQAHSDGSAAVLWSQGGGIFGAEYANGLVGQTYAALAGDLATTNVIQLPNDTVGLTWVQNGDAWAEIFNPATGSVERADLGAATGDFSTVHALALNSGDMAVSWHTGAGVQGQVLTAAGHLASSPTLLMGDLVGVMSVYGNVGVGVTVADDGHGQPFFQYLSISDYHDGFWVH
jgi:hypothetical protein